MESHGIAGDFQIPYHSPKAVSVCAQICHDAKLTTMTLNGDIWDCRKLAQKYPSDDGAAEVLLSTMTEELERGKTVVHEFVRHVKAKKWRLISGNHEYRLWRAMTLSPATLQLMGVKSVRHALSVLALYDLEKFKFEYAGEYPRGLWLADLPPDQNVWVEHGYIARKRSGYTASALMQERMTSVVCGHVERLALITQAALGRGFFGIEGGNLSCIGVPGEGDNIYTGIPHSVPDYMNHTQGFAIIHRDGHTWFPEIVKIADGKAYWNGKLYKG